MNTERDSCRRPARGAGAAWRLGAWTLVRLALAALGALGCAAPAAEPAPAPDATWSVTAWGRLYEVFPVAAVLNAGETATAHVHVTRLGDFAAVTEGTVEIVLSGRGGEEVFTSESPEDPGIFRVEVRPQAAGESDLSFRIQTPAGAEEIRGGRVRVGTAERPGSLLVAPAPRGATGGGQPLDFLKEEQWQSSFATAWVRSSELPQSVAGVARLRPPAGGAATVTAPVDGVLHPYRGSASWPFPGRRVGRGETLFRLVPRVAADRSLPALDAELAALDAELGTARVRLERLRELFDLEATSQREVEDATTRVETLEARRAAAAQDLEAAQSTREGGHDGGLLLPAPFAGEIAAVPASPESTVAAGAPLARLVQTDRVWVEVALSPAGARRLAEGEAAGLILDGGESPAVRLDAVRLVAIAPELTPQTGTVAALLEIAAVPGLALGSLVEAQILLADPRPGVVVPASALVDDGGVPIVYLQLAGESFVRQEVRVAVRQGDRLLVDGLVPGQRLVERGGEAIRRSSLMASGGAHGHVH